MDFIIGILLGIFWIGGIIFMRSITTFFHEMGHAIPALLFTKEEKVQVLIGSYGDIKNAVQLSLGRLVIYLKINLFNWRIGLCSHEPIKGFIPQILVILGGPMASLMIASLAFYYIKANQFSETWIIFTVLFLISALFDFLVNIDPSHQPIKLYDNSTTYSDGYQLVQAFKRRRLPESFYAAEKLFINEQYPKTVDACLNILESENQDKPTYDLMIKACMAQKDFAAALQIYDSMKAIHPYTYLDFYQIGWLNYQLEKYEDPLPYFDHCLYEKHDDGLALAYRGAIHIHLGNWQRAKQDLTASIAYAPNNAVAWSNRGLLHLKNGDLLASEQDLKQAYQLAPENPKVLFHLGLLAEKNRDFKKALFFFQSAKTQGLTYHGIDLKIAEIEAMVDAFL